MPLHPIPPSVRFLRIMAVLRTKMSMLHCLDMLPQVIWDGHAGVRNSCHIWGLIYS